MKLDAKNLLITLVLILVMIAIPQIESSRKSEIANIFGSLLTILTPLTDCGILGILLYSCIVSLWDGISILPVRYVEFFVAISFNTVHEYVLVMIIGKTLGGIVTYKMANTFMKNEEVEAIIHHSTFCVAAVSDLIIELPILYGLIIRMFFPSMLNCLALALLPLNQAQFVFIQFLHSLILAWPQAVFDYHPYIARKFNFDRHGKVHAITEDHEMIILGGIESRMDIYRLGYHIAQVIALLFLAIKVYGRNKLLQVKFLARVKRRLRELNKEQGI